MLITKERLQIIAFNCSFRLSLVVVIDGKHYCDLPGLDYVDYGDEWTCEDCGRAWVKAEDEDRAYWEEV